MASPSPNAPPSTVTPAPDVSSSTGSPTSPSMITSPAPSSTSTVASPPSTTTPSDPSPSTPQPSPPAPVSTPPPQSSPPPSPPVVSPSPPVVSPSTPVVSPSPPVASPSPHVASPPTAVTSPPPSPPPSPALTSPPPPVFSPPPPSNGSAPESPVSPVASSPPPPPPSEAKPPSVPPPTVPSPPPPPSANPPTNSPPPPIFVSPPISSTPPPPGNFSSPPVAVTPSTSNSPNVTPPPPPSPPPANDTSTTNPVVNPPPPSSGGLSTAAVAGIAITVGFLMLGLIAVAAWFVKKRKRKTTVSSGGYYMPSPYGSSERSDSFFVKPYSSVPLVKSGSRSEFMGSPPQSSGLGNSKSFTYEELQEITNGFSPQNLLGEGGFGCVYKGCLPDGREVAVKQLKVGGGQGEREFRAEVDIISRVHHRHLVSLVGYCIAEHQRLLVYDYVPNNTLYYHLHGKGMPVIDWATRVKIAAGAARGMAYLHEDCHPRIIHRDIKSSNILLDNNFEAQVSDFGLAKLALDADTHVTTRVMGTFGYMAPEYASSGKLTEKSDVYSFGVMLLELITGRKPVDASQPLGDESLVEWARPLINQVLDSENFDGLADPRLENNYVRHEMFRLIEAAAACIRHSAPRRPRMGQVVRVFDSLGDTSDLNDLSNGLRPGESKLYNSTLQSAQIRMFQRMAFGSQDYSSGFMTENSWRSRESGTSQEHERSREYGNSHEFGQ